MKYLQSSITGLSLYGLLFVLVSGGVQCGKSLPVQELTEARLQIDAAEQDQAPEYAPASFQKAREALLAAHQNLSEENYDQARVNATQATGLALTAREESAPKMVAAREEAARTEIAAADAAYAEVLAAQDFAAAQSLFQEGSDLKTEAEQGKTQADDGAVARRMDVLAAYSTAGRKFADSATAAEQAKNVALAQKGDMLDSLDGIRSNLEKAENWGAGADEVNDLATARATLARAESEINAGQLKQGNTTMQEAETLSKNLLAKVAANYAQKKLAEATAAVAKAETGFGEINTEKNRKETETRDILDTIDAQLTAAREARDSAKSFYEKNDAEQSISESEDAIRLSQIVYEQYNLLASAQTRDSSEIGEGGDDTTVAEVDETPEGWREYTVKRKTPADCLWCIAKRTEIYGNGRLWHRIYQANKTSIKNPNVIFPGQRLWIPPAVGDVTGVKDEEEIKVDSDESTEDATIMEKVEEAVESMDDTMSPDSETEDQPAESVE